MPPFKRPSIPSALAASAAKSGLPLIDPRTGGKLFGPDPNGADVYPDPNDLYDYLSKRVANGAGTQDILADLTALGFTPADSAQILNVLPLVGAPRIPGSVASKIAQGNRTQAEISAALAAEEGQTTAAASRPIPPPQAPGTPASTQSAQTQPQHPARGGRPSLLASLVSGAPAVLNPIPAPRGNKWHDALPGLGVALGNALGGAAMAQNQQFEKDMAAQKLQLEKEQAARLTEESRLRMAATKQEMGINTLNALKTGNAQYDAVPAEEALVLAQKGNTKVAYANAISNGEYEKAAGLLSELPSPSQIERQRTRAAFQAAGLDPNLADVYSTPLQARQALLYELQAAAATRDAKDIAEGRITAESKPGLLTAYTREIGDIDAQITSLSIKLAEAKAAEAQVENMRKIAPDQANSFMSYLGMDGLDSSILENQINSLKASRSAREAAIKGLYPGEKDLVAPLPDTTGLEVRGKEYWDKKMDDWMKENLPGANGGGQTLTPEQEALSSEIATGRPKLPGLPGTMLNVGRGMVGMVGALAGAPVGAYRSAAAWTGQYDKDPAFLQMVQNVQRQVQADKAAKVPGAESVTMQDIILQAQDEYIRSISHGAFFPEAIFDTPYLQMTPEQRAALYQSAHPPDTRSPEQQRYEQSKARRRQMQQK